MSKFGLPFIAFGYKFFFFNFLLLEKQSTNSSTLKLHGSKRKIFHITAIWMKCGNMKYTFFADINCIIIFSYLPTMEFDMVGNWHTQRNWLLVLWSISNRRNKGLGFVNKCFFLLLFVSSPSIPQNLLADFCHRNWRTFSYRILFSLFMWLKLLLFCLRI